jgi:hypothetical protein
MQQATRSGMPTLFNFGAASYLTLLKTPKRLECSKDGLPPPELRDESFIKKHNVTDEFVNEVRLLASNKAARSLIERSLRPSVNQVFVIMKLGDAQLDSAYQGVIVPLGNQFKYKVVRIGGGKFYL